VQEEKPATSNTLPSKVTFRPEGEIISQTSKNKRSSSPLPWLRRKLKGTSIG